MCIRDRSTPVRPVKSVAVIGAGTMGGGIAMNFLSAGIPVAVSYTHLRAHETVLDIVCRLLLEKQKQLNLKHH